MYNTPRAASIVASSDSVLWAMDRETFRTVILQVEWYVVSSE
jgi:cAMP-dependent protein kinase regulator